MEQLYKKNAVSWNGDVSAFFDHPLIVVDDNFDDTKFLTQALTLCCNPHQTIMEFSSGNDFLNYADALKSAYPHLQNAPEKMPDMIFLDLVMPGLTGQDVLKILRADDFWENIPIMISTQLHEDDIMYEIIRHGANGLLMKPYDKIEVSTAITKTNHFADFTVRKPDF